MPTGGVMSPRAVPARQRVWGVSTGFIVVPKKSVPGVEKGPEQRVEGENAGEQVEYEVPVACPVEQGADHGGEQGRADVAAHVHDREDRGDPLAAELDGDRVAADAAERRREGTEGQNPRGDFAAGDARGDQHEDTAQRQADDRNALAAEPAVA